MNVLVLSRFVIFLRRQWSKTIGRGMMMTRMNIFFQKLRFIKSEILITFKLAVVSNVVLTILNIFIIIQNWHNNTFIPLSKINLPSVSHMNCATSLSVLYFPSTLLPWLIIICLNYLVIQSWACVLFVPNINSYSMHYRSILCILWIQPWITQNNLKCMSS